MRHRSRYFATLIALLPAPLAAQPAPGSMVVTVTHLRVPHGQILACLVATARAFPDCSRDPAAHKLIVKVEGPSAVLDFGHVPPGTWAIAVIHDENGNGRMDKTLMMPKEGYGFSRDAPVRFGPPRFAAAAFPIGDAAPAHMAIRMRYMF